jgi:hypothetical protein
MPSLRNVRQAKISPVGRNDNCWRFLPLVEMTMEISPVGRNDNCWRFLPLVEMTMEISLVGRND